MMLASLSAAVACLCLCLVHLRLVSSQVAAGEGAVAQPEYPAYAEVPAGLQFTCASHAAGYYADPDTRCQVWHWCLPSGQQFSFLCPNGTVFNQAFRVCDWWFNVDCSAATSLYSVNDDLYRTAANP